MTKIVNQQYIGHAIDGLYNACLHAYAIMPSLFEQASYGTDIQPWNWDGFKTTAIRANEHYAMTVNKPLVYLLAVVGLTFALLIVLYLVNPNQRLYWLVLLLAAAILLALIAL